MRQLGLIFSIVVVVLIAAGPAMAERRLALVVGNSDYRNTPSLENPKNDARAMATALTRLGFDVIRGIDLTSVEMRRTVRKFAGALQSADIALFYYAGHGLQVKGQNYLVPIDAKMRSTLDLEFEATNLQVVIDLMEREAKTNFVFLDACRDNPLARTLARSLGASRSTTIGQGLARINSGVGTLIAYSTEPGNVALDGDGEHSPFTEALLRHIETPGLEVGQMLRRVRSSVLKQTRGKQVPWDHSSLVGDFYFGPPKKVAAIQLKTQKGSGAAPFDPRQIELSIWDSIKDSRNPIDFQDYLKQFPKGTFAPWARTRLSELKRGPTLTKRSPSEQVKPTPPKKKVAVAPPPPPVTRVNPAPRPSRPVIAGVAKGSSADARRLQDQIDALKEEGLHGDCEMQIHDTRDRDPAAWAECEERTEKIAKLQRRMTREIANTKTVAKTSPIVAGSPAVAAAPPRVAAKQPRAKSPDRPSKIDFARDRQSILEAVKSYYKAEGSRLDRPDAVTGGSIESVETFEAVRQTAAEIEVRLKFRMSPRDSGRAKSNHHNRFVLKRQGSGYRVLKMWSATLGWVSR
jgi:hypothetical protein